MISAGLIFAIMCEILNEHNFNYHLAPIDVLNETNCDLLKTRNPAEFGIITRHGYYIFIRFEY